MNRFQDVRLIDGGAPGTYCVQFFDAAYNETKKRRLMLAEAEHLDGLIASGATPETLDAFVYKLY